jgi:hypothetical protein
VEVDRAGDLQSESADAMPYPAERSTSAVFMVPMIKIFGGNRKGSCEYCRVIASSWYSSR